MAAAKTLPNEAIKVEKITIDIGDKVYIKGMEFEVKKILNRGRLMIKPVGMVNFNAN